MITLRGHHLVCLNFFKGEGYDEVFVNNLREIMKRIDAEVIKIADGLDDVCRSCFHLIEGRCQYDENAEVKIKEMDGKALKLLNLEDKSLVYWDEIRKNIPLIFSDWYARYCLDCDWLKVCNKNEFFKSLKEV